ncbi:hypothetical protein EV363DRAFT_1338704 [Boletus edulis]|nr:hypothetical protein EV363DRAFT_1338704 [Boletus edulis]
MFPGHPPSNVFGLYGPYASQNTPDELDEFLWQILSDTPISFPAPAPTPTPTYVSASAPAPTPALTTAPAPAPTATPDPQLTCQWVTQNDPPLVCGAFLSQDPRLACAHFRLAHNIRGNDKVTVDCHWYACRAAPMQRGSLIRHVLSVHLGVLRWQCEACGRVFSRRGTSHVCGGEAGA